MKKHMINYVKKHMKKISLLFAAATMVSIIFTGCGQDHSDTSFVMQEGQSDLEYVQSKGTLVVGITDFAPMDYREGEEWVGFDADLAEAFAESIGVSIEFVEIDWDKKTELLEKGSIDCIWNGMTRTEKLRETISCSDPYLSNAQVIILRSGEMEQYHSVESCQHLLFAVEAGSTGESLLKEMNYRYKTFSTQMEALQSVSEKKADATVIDIIMAEYYTGDGREFDNLGFDMILNDEVNCVGLRKDSDLTGKVNEFLKASYEDGTINALADRYGIESAVIDLTDR